ncbi:FAD-binding oxidoreductase [Thermodesulfobacteriota bacterium]
MGTLYETLAQIIGDEYVSNRREELYFYGRDPSLMAPHEPDYVVMPKTTQEVQKIVELANKEKIAVVPKGGGLALTGVVIPLKGGILMDMKRMDQVLEVNEKARYVLIEGGTTQAKLKTYLEKHHPNLTHCTPEAPPIVTVAANAVLHGQGRLTQQYGFTSDMVTGLEVVLPTGEICKIGSCSVSPYWFSKAAPLPDLSGLFLGWMGTTGIITKMGFKLYPRKKMKDIEIFVTDIAELVPDILFKLTHTEMVEDILLWFQPYPLMFKGNYHINISITGDSDEEIEFKRKMIWDAVREYIDNKDGGFMWVAPDMKRTFLQNPQKDSSSFADLRRGGGFVYGGPIMPIEKFPVCVRKLEELSDKYKIAADGAARVIGRSHCMMFAFSVAFNRADPDEMERVSKALHESAEFALEHGGVPWKANIDEQTMILEKMDPNTMNLMKKIKDVIDPNGIMNPGNWEIA